jgi:hypothetical protein
MKLTEGKSFDEIMKMKQEFEQKQPIPIVQENKVDRIPNNR